MHIRGPPRGAARDASDQRVLKTAVDADENERHTAYVFETLELRRAAFNDGDYTRNDWTEVPYLFANGVRLARVVWHQGATSSLPELTDDDVEADLHVLLELGDHLGSTSTVLDLATGELVEKATFYGYGGTESDYRPGRWGSFREDYRFTGKEEDTEVGLTYFGKRYLNAQLGRWVSADPLGVHGQSHERSPDLNMYAYVRGASLKSVDPVGLDARVLVDQSTRTIEVSTTIWVRASEEATGLEGEALERRIRSEAAAWQREINREWNGPNGEPRIVDGYQIHFSVSVRSVSERKGDLRAGDNEIIYDPNERSMTSGARKGNWRSAKAARHEFGHLLGLGDRYIERWTRSTPGEKGRRISSREQRGYERSVMGEYGRVDYRSLAPVVRAARAQAIGPGTDPRATRMAPTEFDLDTSAVRAEDENVAEVIRWEYVDNAESTAGGEGARTSGKTEVEK